MADSQFRKLFYEAQVRRHQRALRKTLNSVAREADLLVGRLDRGQVVERFDVQAIANDVTEILLRVAALQETKEFAWTVVCLEEGKQ